MKNAKQEPAEIDVSSNIPDEVMNKYPTEKIGETEAIVIEPKDIPERDLSDFDI